MDVSELMIVSVQDAIEMQWSTCFNNYLCERERWEFEVDFIYH